MKMKYMEMLKEAVLEFLKDEDTKVILFGSRARNDNVMASDVDIGIIPKGHSIIIVKGVYRGAIEYTIQWRDLSSAEYRMISRRWPLKRRLYGKIKT